MRHSARDEVLRKPVIRMIYRKRRWLNHCSVFWNNACPKKWPNTATIAERSAPVLRCVLGRQRFGRFVPGRFPRRHCRPGFWCTTSNYQFPEPGSASRRGRSAPRLAGLVCGRRGTDRGDSGRASFIRGRRVATQRRDGTWKARSRSIPCRIIGQTRLRAWAFPGVLFLPAKCQWNAAG